jgi:uncharacterized protein YbjT (DUF2867 family)
MLWPKTKQNVMQNQNYTLILGATGNLGGKVLREMLQRGQRVGAVVRDKSRLQGIGEAVDVLAGDFHDDAFLQEAFSRATALFCTVPDTALATPKESAQRLVCLLERSPIQHVVNISNATLTRNDNETSLIVFEKELSQVSGIAVKHLRCANFFENLNWGIDTPYLPDLQLPYISAYEIAHVAVDYLQQHDFTGISTDELLGERDYSMAELAEMVGRTYTQLPYSESNVGFYRPFNENNFELVKRTEVNTSIPRQDKFTLKYFIQNDLKLN